MLKKEVDSGQQNLGNKRVGQVISTPSAKRQKSESNSPNSDSSRGSSDVPVVTASNQDLIVTIREAKTTAGGADVMLLSISNARPNTALGALQGDHVTAYKSFLEMLIAASEGQNIKKLSYLIADIAKALLPERAERFDNILENLEKEKGQVVSRSQRRVIVEQLKTSGTQDETSLGQIKQALKDARKSVFMRASERMAEGFIKQVNLDEETAFRKEGAADKAEGSRVKKAIHALKAINDLKSIYDDTTVSEAKINRFYKRFIETGAAYKDGANAIFTESKVTELNKKWDTLLNKEAFLKKLYSDVDKKQIGNFFGDLFDFKYSVHGGKAKSEQLLFKVIAKHLVVMFRAFDEFQSFDQATKDSVINKFLDEKVLKDQKWGDLQLRSGTKTKPLQISMLNDGVKSYAKLDKFKMKSSAEIDQARIPTAKKGRSK